METRRGTANRLLGYVFEKADYQLKDLIDRIQADPSNAGYLMLLGKYSTEEIENALDEMGK